MSRRPSLHVVVGGLLTTVQDHGRWGWQACGVSVAGPMDPRSHRLANALVGNERDAASIEITLAGPELEFEDDRLCAIAGADWEVTLGGTTIPMHAAVRASGGDRLRFGPRRRGARAYVAIEGGIDVPPVFGSRSTHVLTGIGGHEGRALRAGDRLPLGNRRRDSVSPARSSKTIPDLFANRVRMLPGPHLDWFAPDALVTLQSSSYVVGIRSDRMGYRLEGPALMRRRSDDMISGPTALGALQVTASGEPILLMADRQTIGGYPILATVVGADIGRVGQLGPGDSLSFAPCSVQEAMAALIAEEQALMAVEARG